MPPLREAIDCYIESLKAHDVDQIAKTVSDRLRFVCPGRTLNKPSFLELLRAIYTGFPDWSYDHDQPVVQGEESHGSSRIPIPSLMATAKSSLRENSSTNRFRASDSAVGSKSHGNGGNAA